MGEFEEKQIDIKKQYSGTTYQIKVLLLLLCRGKKIKSYDDFYLKTEVKDAEKFDDALFYYKKKGEEIYNVRYCQVKNSESKNAELKYNDFVSDYDKAVANIKKYFISYRKIKMRTVNKNVEDFTLCTSYKLPLELKKNEKADGDAILTFIEDGASDELFGNIPNQLKKYKIAKISSELNNSLLKTTNLDLLAEELIEAVLKCKKQESSTVILECGNFWLSKYQDALKSENVFTEKTKINNNSKTSNNKNSHYVFTEEFLKNICISKECENLRKTFMHRCGVKYLNIFLRDKKFSTERSFQHIIGNMGNNASQEIQTDIVEKLAKKISEYIFETKPLTNEIFGQNEFLNNVFKIADTSLENSIKFTGDFVQNKNLTKTAEQFRKYFLESYTILELKNLKLKLVQSFKVDNKFETLINNDDDIENEMEQFFEEFSIQTMPHHDELMDIIKKEIGEEFNLLEDKWVTKSLLEKVEEWFKKSEEIPFDKSSVDTYFSEIKKDILIQMAERNFYIEMLKTYNLSFAMTPDTWKKFLKSSTIEFSTNRTLLSQLLIISTKEPILTAIKVENAIREFDFYRKQGSFIIIPASVLVQMENTAKYVTNLHSIDGNDLIIIIDDNYAATLTLFSYPQLKTIRKKFILITNGKTSEYEILQKSYMFQDEEDSFHFNELTSTSQNYILEKNVIFQGTPVLLNTVINEDAFHLIDSKTIITLISNNATLEIGKMLEPYKEYDERFYIERKIGLNIMKDDFFVKTFLNCVFLIDGTNIDEIHQFLNTKKVDQKKISLGQWNLHSVFVLYDSERAEEIFEEMCKNVKNHQIYWFKFRNGNLFWFHCSETAFDTGKKESPLLFTKTFNEDENTAVNFLSQSKTVIFTDSPGMGKSTILTALSNKIQNTHSMWKVRIDLNKYTKYFLELKEKLPKEKDDYKDLGKYAMDKIYGRIPPNEEEKPFEFRVFDKMFRQNKVLLIFDGFDEVSPVYETLMLSILEKMKNNTQNHLWITSRLNMKQKLERKLKTISFTIMPFTVDDQNGFLTKFWRSNWKTNWSQNHERHLKIYAEVLVSEFNEMTERNDTDIIGIPLQTKMLGDVFQENDKEDRDWQSCYTFLKGTLKCDSKICRCSPFLRNKLQNLYILYKAFVKIHITRYLKEKNDFDSSKVGWLLTDTLFYNEALKAHKILGMFALLNDEELKKLITEEECEIKQFWMQEIQTGNASFGLISYVSTDGKPFFTHLTFAEFFAAKYLNEKLIFSPFQVFELMDIILQQDVPVFLYCVKYLMRTDICTKELEKALGNTTVVNFVSKHGFVNCFNNFTQDDDFEYDFPLIDNLGKSPLHYAAEFNHIKSVIFILLQKYNRLSKSDIREFREIDDEDESLISIERKTRLFLLQDFITLADINGKTALDYSTDPQINDILNDFIKIGKNNLIPNQKIRPALSDIQWIKSKYDFAKELKNNEPVVLMKDVIYLCSLKTLTAIIDNCDIKEGILSSNNNRDFFDSIFSRENISESEKIIFFQNLLAKYSPSDLRKEIVAAILRTSIIYNNRKVFKHFFQDENIHQLPEEFNSCYVSAAEAKNFRIINFLFSNMEKNLTLDLSDFLHPVKTDVIVLERIFEQFKGNAESERRYAEKILLKELADTYQRLPILKIKYLLSKQPGIYLTDDQGKTSWDYAIKPYFDDHLELLVPCISDPKIRNIAQKYYKCKNSDQVFNCLEAFEQDDEMFCLFLIRNCRSMDMKDEGGKTPLIHACEKGWLNVVKHLLETGSCYEDVFDENGKLFDCCIKNNDIAKLLQEVKLHFSTLTFSSVFDDSKVFWGTVNKEQKPLWYIVASKGGTSDILSKSYKLRSFHSEKFRDSEGNTSLHLAAKCGIIEIVEVLLRCGECYEAKNNSNQTPADLAKSNDIKIIFKKLDKLFEVVKSDEEIFNKNFYPKRDDVAFAATDIYGKTLLHYAVINGFYFYVKRASFNISTAINFRDIYNKTSLPYAIERSDAKTVKLLFPNEGKLGKKNYCDNIEDNESKYVIEILNQLFTDIDNHDINGFMEKIDTLSFSPVSDFKIGEILNVKNETGKNMFEQALNLNDYDLTIFLLKKGVEIDIYANQYKNPKIIRLINFINKIFDYVETDAFETSSIIRLIEENNLTEIIPKVKVLFKDTLLHKSVEENNPEMVEWLIRNGADVSAQNFFAETALDLAKACHNIYIIELLTRPRQRNSTNTIKMNKNKFNSKNEILSLQSYPYNNKIIHILKNLDSQQPFGDEIKKSDNTIINRHGFRDKKDWIKFWKHGANIKLDTLLDIINVVDILTINIISKKKIPFVAYFNPEWWQGINPFNKTSIYSEEELIGFYGVNISQTTKFIFFPLLINFHWITFVYDVDKNKLSCYDPIYKNYFQGHWKNYYRTCTFFIEKFIFIIYGKSIDTKKKKSLTQEFHQKDEASSGLFISKYMEVVMDRGIFPTNFNINEYRTEIIELFNQIAGKAEKITTSNHNRNNVPRINCIKTVCQYFPSKLENLIFFVGFEAFNFNAFKELVQNTPHVKYKLEFLDFLSKDYTKKLQKYVDKIIKTGITEYPPVYLKFNFQNSKSHRKLKALKEAYELQQQMVKNFVRDQQ